jgi:aspartate-semialdehyde dehydrogenase
MKPGYVIAVVGATGFVGKELATALHMNTQIPIRLLKLFGSSKRVDEDIYLDHERYSVQPLSAKPLEGAQFDNVDIVFLATPRTVSRKLAPILLDEGMIVVDIGGWVYEGAPKSVMGLNVHEEFFTEERYISIPNSPAYILSHVLWKLQSFGLKGARAHISVGASYRGRAGVEELSGQVAAVFNYRDAPRNIFSQGLAFDLAPSIEGMEEDATRIRDQVAHILGMEESSFDISMLFTPIFSGLGIQLQVLLRSQELAEIQEELTGGIMGWSPSPHGPKLLMGGSGIQFGSLRHDGIGEGIHMWISADGIRAGIVDNSCGVIISLIEKGLL